MARLRLKASTPATAPSVRRGTGYAWPIVGRPVRGPAYSSLTAGCPVLSTSSRQRGGGRRIAAGGDVRARGHQSAVAVAQDGVQQQRLFAQQAREQPVALGWIERAIAGWRTSADAIASRPSKY